MAPGRAPAPISRAAAAIRRLRLPRCPSRRTSRSRAAKNLLADAGASGATFNFGAPNGRYLMDKQIGEAIAGYLEAVGLKVVSRTPRGARRSRGHKFEKAKYDAISSVGCGQRRARPAHGRALPTRRIPAHDARHAEGPLLVDARESFDDARVRADYRKAQGSCGTSAPGSGSTSSPTCSRSARTQGSPGRATSTWLFWNASLEG